MTFDHDESPQTEIYINEELMGLSPVLLEDMFAGDYTIKVEKKGYGEIVRNESVSPSERRLIHLELQVDDKLTPKIVHKKGEDAVGGTGLESKPSAGIKSTTLP